MITILDACCAINLHNGGVLDRVLELRTRTWIIGPRVLEECADEYGAALREKIALGNLTMLDDSRITASLYLSLLSDYRLGDGETECIAAATVDQAASIATDDGRARSIALSLFEKKRVTGSLGILKECVAATLLETSEAYAAYIFMIQAGAFLPTVGWDFFGV